MKAPQRVLSHARLIQIRYRDYLAAGVIQASATAAAEQLLPWAASEGRAVTLQSGRPCMLFFSHRARREPIAR
jgi:hypothetical protein